MESIFDFLFELIITIFVEGFAEGFVSLYTVFVPHQTVSAKAHKIITGICEITALFLLIGLFAGIIIAVETKGQCSWGWVLIGFAIVYVLVGIALKLFSHKRASCGK